MCFCLWSRYFSNYSFTYIKEIPPTGQEVVANASVFAGHHRSPHPPIFLTNPSQKSRKTRCHGVQRRAAIFVPSFVKSVHISYSARWCSPNPPKAQFIGSTDHIFYRCFSKLYMGPGARQPHLRL